MANQEAEPLDLSTVIYNPSTPVQSPSLLPEPINWEQIPVIHCQSPLPRPHTSNNGSSTAVESIDGILY
ncbi:hypothetical protein OG21DRAFT_1490648 [Imleria badia]|nr:hypothetical protein OG21DRAFT_1490648 [Imleria badia]